MCTVSMIVGHYQSHYRLPNDFPPDRYYDYQELLRKAKLYDEIMKQKDCPDPEKEQWHKALEEFMLKRYGLSPQGGVEQK